MITRGITWKVLLGCLLAALGAFYWLDRIDVAPSAGGDEQDLVSNFSRLGRFGDRHELVFISENYNQRAWQKLPSPWTGWLRAGFHAAVGCSSRSSRVFSAAALLACVAIAAVAAPLRSRVPPRAVLLLAATALLSPPLYFAARTVRLEQEILLLGVGAMFGIPCLLRPGSPPALRLVLWALAGGLCGWAGISHPGGLVFPAAQLLLLLRFPAAWAEHDGLTTSKRLAAWLVGAAIPVAIMGAILAADWTQWVAYHCDLESRYAAVSARLVAFWAPQWPGRLGSESPWLAATLYSYFLSATSPSMEYSGRWLLAALFAAESAVVLGAAVWSFWRPCPSRGLLFRGLLWLAAGFILMHFLYAYRLSPNYTFSPYLGLTVPLACAWMAYSTVRTFRFSMLRVLPVIAVLGILAVNLHFAWHQAGAVRQLAATAPVTLDTRIDAARTMGDRLGWSDGATPLYIDNLTWPCAGPHWKSLFEALLAEHVPPPGASDRVALDDDFVIGIFDYPGFGQTQLTPDERLKRLGGLLTGRRLAGVLLNGRNPSAGNSYFYASAAETVGPLRVGMLRGKADVVWATAGRSMVSGRWRPDADYPPFARGTCLAVLSGQGLARNRFRLLLQSPGQPSPAVLAELGGRHAVQAVIAQAAVIEVAEPGARLLIEATSDEKRPSMIPPASLMILVVSSAALRISGP
jgi:hypothetical protein